MRLFGKSKSEELDNVRESDDIAQAEDHETGKPKAHHGSGSAKIDRMQLEIESLKLQVTSLKELIKENNERFTRVNEQIGEIRTFGTEREKKIRDIELKSEKSVALVSEVHPETLMAELRKETAKMDALRAKIDAQEAVSGRIITELKDIKVNMAAFRGIEQVVRLNKETTENLGSIQKVQSMVERHADRVETIFGIVEKNFREFAKFKDMAHELDGSFMELGKEFDSYKAKFTTLATKDEMFRFEKSAGALTEKTSDTHDKFLHKEKEWNQKIDELGHKMDMCLQTADKLEAKNIDIIRIFSTIQKSIEDFEKMKVSVSENSMRTDMANHHIDSLLDTLSELAEAKK